MESLSQPEIQLVQASEMLACALIYFSGLGSELELARLSFVFVRPPAMEWAWLSSCDAYESVLAMARKLS